MTLAAASTVERLLEAVVQGIPVGAVFALVAVGFVLTFTTTGVFNLAFGAQAFISAAAYFELHVRRGWPIWLALAVAVFLLAPLVGLALDRLVFRHLRSAGAVPKLVASLGLLVALPAAFVILVDFERAPSFGAVGIVPDGRRTIELFGIHPVTLDELVQLAVAVVATVVLAVVLRRTRLGLRIRAVVESPRMSELRGVNAEAVSAVAWMSSSLFAGLAGVLLAPRFVTVQPTAFFQFVVIGIAAAAVGRLVSLSGALIGGLALGVATTVVATFVDPTSLVGQHLGPALPYVVLFAAIVLLPSLRQRAEAPDPLAGVDPPPPTVATPTSEAGGARGLAAVGVVTLALVGLWTMVAADELWLLLVTEAVILAVILCSITVITGLGGQISLAQATFAAVGAFATLQLAERFDLPVLIGAVAGAAVAAGIGALLAVGVVRLGGIWLALATLAFAMLFDTVVVKLDWVGGGMLAGGRVPRPVLGPLDFTANRSFLVLCVVVLAGVGVGVVRLRRGSTGMVLGALSGDERAARSVGISPWKGRVAAFGLAAALAGLGGALLAIRQGTVIYETTFSPFLGLFWLLVVVVVGCRTVRGAIVAAVVIRILPELAPVGTGSGAALAVVFGIAAIAYARHPEGLFEYALARLQAALGRVRPDDRPRDEALPA